MILTPSTMLIVAPPFGFWLICTYLDEQNWKCWYVLCLRKVIMAFTWVARKLLGSHIVLILLWVFGGICQKLSGLLGVLGHTVTWFKDEVGNFLCLDPRTSWIQRTLSCKPNKYVLLLGAGIAMNHSGQWTTFNGKPLSRTYTSRGKKVLWESFLTASPSPTTYPSAFHLRLHNTLCSSAEWPNVSFRAYDPSAQLPTWFGEWNQNVVFNRTLNYSRNMCHSMFVRYVE